MIFIFLSCEDKKEPPTLGEDIIPDEEITLANCEEDINEDAPTFFRKYFKCVDIEVNNDQVIISTDGIPPYLSWYFSDSHPNHIEFESQGVGYYLNPNSILSHNIEISIPIDPIQNEIDITDFSVDGVVGNDINEYNMGVIGSALNGVAMFNPLAAPGDDIEAEKFSFDYYSGHPEMTGMYHYHTTSKGPLEVLEHQGIIETTVPGSGEIEVYGIMCDGTVILGCTELNGDTPDDLGFDAQNGHIHYLVDDENTIHFNEERYHTHMCPEVFTNHKFTPELQYYNECNRSF